VADRRLAGQQNQIDTMLDRTPTALFRTLIISAMLVAGLVACNPFAPRLEDIVVDRNQVLGNRNSVSGFFDWFRSSYELRDTLLYGQMLARDFQFSYLDFTNNNTVYWDRDIDMRTTYNLFKAAKSTSVQWQHYVYADTLNSDTSASVERYFNVTVVLDDQSIFRSTGSARIVLRRKSKFDFWQIVTWFDKSDF
jgi:hypothetical protein